MNRKEEKVILSEFLKNVLTKEVCLDKNEKNQVTEELVDMSSMKNIKKIIDRYDWNLGVSEYRYGGGHFVFVAPSENYVQRFDELAYMPGDIAAIDFYFYVTEEGSWLPIVYDMSIEDGLHKLNKNLKRSITPEWQKKVEKAYNVIDEVTDNSYGLSSKVKEKMPELMG